MDRETIYLSLITSYVALSFGAWVFIARRRKTQGYFLRPGPPREPRWDGMLAVTCFLIHLILPAFMIEAFRHVPGALPVTEAGVWTSEAISFSAGIAAISTIASLVIILVLLRLVAGTKLSDFGFNASKPLSSLATGAIAFFAIAPFIYGMQFFLSHFFTYQHPIIEALQSDDSTNLWIWSTISVVLVAPIAEEFLFRGILQGLIEKIERHHLVGKLLARSPEAPTPFADNVAENATQDGDNPYQPPSNHESTGEAEHASLLGTTSPFMWRPIVITSLFFAMCHITHGSAPIPLFFLSLTLGYLYQRTQNIIPCIALHFLVNLSSMVFLAIELSYPTGS